MRRKYRSYMEYLDVEFVESGRPRPVLAKTNPLKDLLKAQEYFTKKKHVGNIVVTMDPRSAGATYA